MRHDCICNQRMSAFKWANFCQLLLVVCYCRAVKLKSGACRASPLCTCVLGAVSDAGVWLTDGFGLRLYIDTWFWRTIKENVYLHLKKCGASSWPWKSIWYKLVYDIWYRLPKVFPWIVHFFFILVPKNASVMFYFAVYDYSTILVTRRKA